MSRCVWFAYEYLVTRLHCCVGCGIGCSMIIIAPALGVGGAVVWALS